MQQDGTANLSFGDERGMTLVISNDWFTYDKKEDRFRINMDLLKEINIQPGAMERIVEDAKEIMESRKREIRV